MENFISRLLFSAMCIAIAGLVAGLLFALIPKEFFLKNERFFVPFKFEDGGRLYSRVFKINTWKDKLPQFSELTKIGFDKTALTNLSANYLELFKIETMRAEFTHVFLIITSPLYAFFGARIIVPLTVVGSMIGNIPFLMIQRYNRARIEKLMKHLSRTAPNSETSPT